MCLTIKGTGNSSNIQFLEKSLRKLDFSTTGICTIVQINNLKNSPCLSRASSGKLPIKPLASSRKTTLDSSPDRCSSMCPGVPSIQQDDQSIPDPEDQEQVCFCRAFQIC
ncbi:unnamed protein product [Linum tenue]|uniref:Uncharacterized protein n=1 Tax=Linum tenue TaxID=586396 RepID=A0AAV0L5U3_9ROSI|nr:unnamed protein product [Linum tenue]